MFFNYLQIRPCMPFIHLWINITVVFGINDHLAYKTNLSLVDPLPMLPLQKIRSYRAGTTVLLLIQAITCTLIQFIKKYRHHVLSTCETVFKCSNVESLFHDQFCAHWEAKWPKQSPLKVTRPNKTNYKTAYSNRSVIWKILHQLPRFASLLCKASFDAETEVHSILSGVVSYCHSSTFIS